MQPGRACTEIAVVDDDQGVRESIAFLLETVGYDVAQYASTHEFLRDHRCHPLIGLILDERMPGVAGLELTEHLRAEGRMLPILLVTGSPSPVMVARAAELGIKVLEKPYIETGLMAFCAGLDGSLAPT